jgi:diguanylate cyclase (GGDEF)-like protein
MMKDHFSSWKWEGYSDRQACLQAVADGKADCMLISNYNYNNLSRQCERLKLAPVATGKYLDYSIAVQAGNTVLYSILTRTTDNVSKTSTNAALAYYSAEDAKTTLLDFIRDNPLVDIAIVAVVISLLAVIIAQQRIIRAKKEVKESHLQVEDLNKRVFVDALTSVRNKGGFNEYINGLQERIDSGERPEFAVIILDSNDLKPINDHYGHDKGDIYLRTASRLICRVYKHSPVFRIGGDEFAVVLMNDDYRNRDKLEAQFIQESGEIYASAENEWDRVSMAMGMAEYDPKSDDSVDDVVQRADKNMYENKHAWKEAHKG